MTGVLRNSLIPTTDIDRYCASPFGSVVTGSMRVACYAVNADDFPRDCPLLCTLVLFQDKKQEGFPDMSRFTSHSHERAGQYYLPDKEFRYLRTVIVTAAVYWGFDHELRTSSKRGANPIN